MNVNYSQGSWKVDIQPISNNGSFQVKLESEQLNVPIHFTLDGSDLTPQSKVFKELLTINNSTVIKAGLFVDTELKEYYSEKEIVFHKGIGKNAELAKQPSRKYEAHGAMSLVDGLKGSDNFWDNYWLGFEGNDMIFELDLGKEIQISSITASFYQNTGAWIFMPEKVIFEILDAGRNKVERSVLKPESTMEVKGVVIEDISAKFNNETARYVKVHAKNIAKIPNWHEGAGSKAWIFVDEVIVN